MLLRSSRSGTSAHLAYRGEIRDRDSQLCRLTPWGGTRQLRRRRHPRGAVSLGLAHRIEHRSEGDIAAVDEPLRFRAYLGFEADPGDDARDLVLEHLMVLLDLEVGEGEV